MASSADLLANFQTAKTKVERYHSTLKRIPKEGVKLGDIINIQENSSENVLVDTLEKLTQPRSFCCGGWIELNSFDKRARLKMKEDVTNQYR